MAPWKSIEFGFQLGIHVMFGMMGVVMAIALIGRLVWAVWALSERLKP